MSITRGDIYWVNFPKHDPPGAQIEKTRPCVILSLTTVIVTACCAAVALLF